MDKEKIRCIIERVRKSGVSSEPTWDAPPEFLFHGSGTRIDAFDPEFMGHGNDQIGSGFYFTTDIQEAIGYAFSRIDLHTPKIGGEDAPTVHVVRLDAVNPITPQTQRALTPSQVKKIIMASPVRDEALWDWGDLSSESKLSIVARAVGNYAMRADEGELIKRLFCLANDFYPGHEEAFNRQIYKVLGYDSALDRIENKEHWVAFFPEQIEIEARWDANLLKALDPQQIDVRIEQLRRGFDVEKSVVSKEVF